MVDRILEGAPTAVQVSKQLVDAAAAGAPSSILEALASGFTAATDDFAIGVTAFQNKTTPTFTNSDPRTSRSDPLERIGRSMTLDPHPAADPDADTQVPVVTKEDLRKAAWGASAGSAPEYYDFALYSLASALVFGPLFFPTDNPATGLVLSFATYFIGFAVRPLGGVFFGPLETGWAEVLD